MPRPSLAPQRISEILDAFEQCILTVGLQACALEQIAATAGMKRSILRHYIGNKDDIIVALGERWMKYYEQQWQAINQSKPLDGQSEYLLSCLFDHKGADHTQYVTIGEALFSEAKRLDAIAEQQKTITEQFIHHITALLKTEYSDANTAELNEVAHGLYAIYLSSESMIPAGQLDTIPLLKASAKRLIDTLKP